MIKRILKALLASIVIFAFAVIVTFFVNWFAEAYPNLVIIAVIILFLCAGWVFTDI